MCQSGETRDQWQHIDVYALPEQQEVHNTAAEEEQRAEAVEDESGN